MNYTVHKILKLLCCNISYFIADVSTSEQNILSLPALFHRHLHGYKNEDFGRGHSSFYPVLRLLMKTFVKVPLKLIKN